MPHPKPPCRPEPAAAVAAYLRLSNLRFPDACLTPEARGVYVEGLRAVRRSQLAGDAARQGDEITAWYDDMGVSGLGECLDRRTDFERLRADAHRGRVRVVYARDLSRLFRDLIQQEMWFCEMEALGVAVRVQDLPHVADPATRTFVRQQLGAINEYLARRQGEVIRAVQQEQILAGRWVGRTRSFWGLRYDRAVKGFAFDPDTADRACLVYEAFVAEGGVANAAASRLNALVHAGSPRATLTPGGVVWTTNAVMGQVRNPLYRRRIVYGPLVLEAPDRIPEVVPAPLVAEADRLLAARQAFYDAASAACRRTVTLFTYARLLRCSACGAHMRATPWKLAPDGTGRAAWLCGRAIRRGGCSLSWRVEQGRLDVLVAEAVALALSRPASAAPYRPHGTLARRLELLARRRERCRALQASGAVPDPVLLRRQLDRLDQEEEALRGQKAEQALRAAERQAQGAAGGGPPVPVSPSAAARRREQLREAWARPALLLCDIEKRDALLACGAVIRVEIHPYQPLRARPRRSKRQGGPVTLTLELPGLGAVGPLTVVESQAAVRQARGRAGEARFAGSDAWMPPGPALPGGGGS